MNAQDFIFNEEMLALIPEASPSDQAALEEDILSRVKMFGKDDNDILIQNILLDPAGLVIDGRNRINIFKKYDLNIPEKRIRKLKYGATKDRILMEIKSANKGRNLTLTQKAMIASKLYLQMKKKKEKGTTHKRVAKENGIGETTLKNALSIRVLDADIADSLWEGRAVEIINEKGKATTTTSINSVCQYLQREKEKELNTFIDNPHEWDAYAFIKTQIGKDKFKELISQNSGNVDVPIQMALAEYLNITTKQDSISKHT